jgi:hypothetical protein
MAFIKFLTEVFSSINFRPYAIKIQIINLMSEGTQDEKHLV